MNDSPALAYVVLMLFCKGFHTFAQLPLERLHLALENDLRLLLALIAAFLFIRLLSDHHPFV